MPIFCEDFFLILSQVESFMRISVRYEMTGLLPDTDYEFRLRLESRAGAGAMQVKHSDSDSRRRLPAVLNQAAKRCVAAGPMHDALSHCVMARNFLKYFFDQNQMVKAECKNPREN